MKSGRQGGVRNAPISDFSFHVRRGPIYLAQFRRILMDFAREFCTKDCSYQLCSLYP